VLFVSRLGESAGVSCSVYPDYLGSKNLVGAQELAPTQLSGGKLLVQGVCAFSNPSQDKQSFTVRTRVVRKTSPEMLATNLTSVVDLPNTGGLAKEVFFELVWKGIPDGDYTFEFEKIG
jgi:hypothetical protein